MKAPSTKNIKEAYDNGCSDVKKTLEYLYPELKEKTFFDRVTFALEGTEKTIRIDGKVAMWVSSSQNYVRLSDEFSWKMEDAGIGYGNLIPTKK